MSGHPTETCDVQVALTLADQLARLGRIDDALAQYRWAASAFRARGEQQNAVSVYLIMGALAPCCTRTQIECADFYAECGLTEDALAIYEWAERIYIAAGMPAAAAWVLTRAVEAQPESAERRVRLGELCLQIGRPDDAVTAFYGAARRFFAHARTAEFLWVADRILALNPEHTQTLRDASRVRLFLRDIPGVSEHLRTLFRQLPQDIVGGELLAETLALMGRQRDAARVAKLVAKQIRRTRQPEWRADAKRVVDRALQWVPDAPDLLRMRGRIDEDTRIQTLRDSNNESVVTGVVEFISDAVMLSSMAAHPPGEDDDDGPTDIRRSRHRNDDITRKELASRPSGPGLGDNVVPLRRRLG